MRKLTDETFPEAVRNTRKPLVIKFYADWCADCRRIADPYAQFEERYTDLDFAELDTEEAVETTMSYDVRGIPSLLVFERGKLVDRLYSREAKTPQQLEEFLNRQLAALKDPFRAHNA